MQRLLEYLGHHPYIAGGALLAAIAVAVYELRALLQSAAGVGTIQAVQLMNHGALVLDVRSREAFEAGHIGEARNVPLAELAGQAESLAKWRDKNVIVYCDSGVTSASAARLLGGLGFAKIFNLQGGINAWIKDNLPVVKTAPSRRPGPK